MVKENTEDLQLTSCSFTALQLKTFQNLTEGIVSRIQKGVGFKAYVHPPTHRRSLLQQIQRDLP